jgi:hypothetical protein
VPFSLLFLPFLFSFPQNNAIENLGTVQKQGGVSRVRTLLNQLNHNVDMTDIAELKALLLDQAIDVVLALYKHKGATYADDMCMLLSHLSHLVASFLLVRPLILLLSLIL